MKTTYIIVGLSALLIGAGLFAAERAWKMRRQLVTLDIRNAPLNEVLRMVSKQTGRHIKAEEGMSAAITIHAVNQPLQWVLNRIAEQAGAHWTTIYAVYQSASSLKALEAALSGNGKLEPAGWCQLAPGSSELDGAPPEIPDPMAEPQGNAGLGPRGRMMMFRGGPDGRVTMLGPGGQLQVWQPEELVSPTHLASQLQAGNSLQPTAEQAAESARRIQGSWTCYISFQKSIAGVGFAGPMPGQHGMSPFKRNDNERFVSLTPEQRLQRARERKEFRIQKRVPQE